MPRSGPMACVFRARRWRPPAALHIDSPACGRLLRSVLRKHDDAERVTYEQLLGISGCLALALLAHITTLPLWVPCIVVACALHSLRPGARRPRRAARPGAR